jgi:hypothetical protein
MVRQQVNPVNITTVIESEKIAISEDDDEDEEDDDEDEDEDEEDEDEEDNDDDDDEEVNPVDTIKIVNVEFTETDNIDLDEQEIELEIEPISETVPEIQEEEPIQIEKLESTDVDQEVVNSNEGKPDQDVYKNMSIQILKKLVITKGLCSDSSKMKKNDLIKLLEEAVV